MANNAYYNAGYKYVATSAAGLYTIDANVHKWYSAASGTAGNAITFTQAMTLDASGRLGIGQTSPNATLVVEGASNNIDTNIYLNQVIKTSTAYNASPRAGLGFSVKYNSTDFVYGASIQGYKNNATINDYGVGLLFTTQRNGNAPAQRMTLDSEGNLLVGTTDTNPVGSDVNGFAVLPGGRTTISRMGGEVLALNRGTDDGTLMSFCQAGSTEGNISVSGTTVSYNGGHLSRYAQTTTAKDDSLLKGTVLSNLDAMNVYTKDGQPVDNEQLNKVKVSDIEGDANVAGVFVNWSHDEQHNVDEINMAMTGDMIIRIAQGVTVVRGDLLMSAGDGTAKPQGDDIVRSKTVAKVTSNHITCTYADGSYCVPCVLMAC
jgi:hypothetical protein